MRSPNRENRSMTGSRIHRSMEARASCVPDPRPEDLDQELKRIMAPGPPAAIEELPGREPAPSERAAVAVGSGVVGVLQAIGTAAAVMIHAGILVAVVLLVLTVMSGAATVFLMIAPPGSRIGGQNGERPIHEQGALAGRSVPLDE